MDIALLMHRFDGLENIIEDQFGISLGEFGSG